MRMAKMLTIATIALGTIGQTGWGQDERRVVEASTVQQVDGTNWIDIKFQGGTFQDLVNSIKTMQPRANILLEPEAASWKVPAFEAFGVTAAGALELARNMLSEPGNIHVYAIRFEDDDSAPAIGVKLSGSAKRELHWKHNPTPARIPSDAPTKAWNLKGWTMNNDSAIQNTLAAIQLGLESYDNPVVLRYHEPSGVLLARGEAQQIAFVDGIIRAAAEGVGTALTAHDLMGQIRAADDRIAAMQGELKVIQARGEVAIVTRLEAKEHQASKVTIAKAEVDLAEAEAKQAEVSNAILRAKEHRDALQAKLDAMKASSSAP